MAKTVEFDGNVEQVVRANGKPVAKVTINIPAELAATIPLGSVHLTVVPLQKELDLDGGESEKPSRRVRGDRG